MSHMSQSTGWKIPGSTVVKQVYPFRKKQEQKTGIDCPGAKQKGQEVPLLGTKASICISKAQRG